MINPAPAPRSAHVIVFGNEKGGSGKSTTAVHVVVALMKAGFRVASIDTDSRQRTMTRYFENRGRRARLTGIELDLPSHYVVKLGTGDAVREIEAREFGAYADIIDRVEQDFDFVVVDTPASDSYLMRLSHAMADTLVTPVNDSFVDLDVLGSIEPGRLAAGIASHYAELVCSARRERLRVDGVETDWVVLRNRIAPLSSRNQRKVVQRLHDLSRLVGFRIAGGVSERVIFREFFPLGLTALDRLDRDTLGGEPTMSHVAARREIRELIAALRLPIADRADSPGPPPLATSTPDPVAAELVAD